MRHLSADGELTTLSNNATTVKSRTVCMYTYICVCVEDSCVEWYQCDNANINAPFIALQKQQQQQKHHKWATYARQRKAPHEKAKAEAKGQPTQQQQKIIKQPQQQMSAAVKAAFSAHQQTVVANKVSWHGTNWRGGGAATRCYSDK